MSCNISDFKITVYSTGVKFSFTPPSGATSWMAILHYNTAPPPNTPTIYQCGTNQWCYNTGVTNLNPFVLTAYNMVLPGQHYNGVVEFYDSNRNVICEQPFSFDTPALDNYTCMAATTIYGYFDTTLGLENISWQAYAPSYSVLVNGVNVGTTTAQEINVQLPAGTYNVQIVSHCTTGDKTSGSWSITVPASSGAASPKKKGH